MINTNSATANTRHAIEFVSLDLEGLAVKGNASCFRGRSGVEEYHLMLCPTASGSVSEQTEWLEKAYRKALRSLRLSGDSVIFRRFFCSDLVNQSEDLLKFPFANPQSPDVPYAVSWAGQPPMPPAKVALWAYHAQDPNGPPAKTHSGNSLKVDRGECCHYWTTCLVSPLTDSSFNQTSRVLQRYEEELLANQMTMANDLVRTWLFVQDIDSNYKGLVASRKDFFAQRGLTAQTHFIASSGIGSGHADVETKVGMDAYAISGLRAQQIQYMAAPDHLPPPHHYGVTFERGTSVSWRDRKHLILSGTASIDAAGQIMHPGDVARQLERTLENIDALLKNSSAALRDMAMFIVYLRDPSDYESIYAQMRKRVGAAPLQVVLAPVCRPGWLVEVEGIAIQSALADELPLY